MKYQKSKKILKSNYMAICIVYSISLE